MNETITRQRSDPRERLGRLFDDQHQRLFRLALRMVSDDDVARDLVQETFLRAAQRASSLPAGVHAAEAWLVRVLVNLCRDRFRRLKVRREFAAVNKSCDGVEGHEDAVVAAATVRRALERLHPRRRAVVVLHEIEALDDKAVADLLGIAAVTVRWHFAKGKRELASIIGSKRKV